MANWFISVNGDQKGPYPTDQLRQLISDGFVPQDAFVWRDGMAQWQPLSQTRIDDGAGPAPVPAPAARDQGYGQQQQYQPQPQQQAYQQQQPQYGGPVVTDPSVNQGGWFSFQGRISRKTFWLKYVLPIIGIFIVASIPFALIPPDSKIFSIYLAIFGILYLVLLIPNLAASVKRLHDRGRSGWFILLNFVPIANIWIFIEVAFLRGTYGPNAYGPDPTDGA